MTLAGTLIVELNRAHRALNFVATGELGSGFQAQPVKGDGQLLEKVIAMDLRLSALDDLGLVPPCAAPGDLPLADR